MYMRRCTHKYMTDSSHILYFSNLHLIAISNGYASSIVAVQTINCCPNYNDCPDYDCCPGYKCRIIAVQIMTAVQTINCCPDYD